MMSGVLYRREMKNSGKLLVIFAAILTLYISMIIPMFDPEMAGLLRQFEQAMPEVMAAVGMTGSGSTLLGFMTSYLYGMLLLVFPMVFGILRANGLVAKYVDRGSMAFLVTAGVPRRKVAATQAAVLVSGIVLLLAYCTALELGVAQASFPGELAWGELLRVNLGLLGLQLCLGGFCFLCSCCFQETRYSLAVGAGIPVLMYVMQMVANMGDKGEVLKYASVFTLFRPEELASGEGQAIAGTVVLYGLALVFFAAAVRVFVRKDLPV